MDAKAARYIENLVCSESAPRCQVFAVLPQPNLRLAIVDTFAKNVASSIMTQVYFDEIGSFIKWRQNTSWLAEIR